MEINVERARSVHDDHAGGISEAGLRLPGYAFNFGLFGEKILDVATCSWQKVRGRLEGGKLRVKGRFDPLFSAKLFPGQGRPGKKYFLSAYVRVRLRLKYIFPISPVQRGNPISKLR